MELRPVATKHNLLVVLKNLTVSFYISDLEPSFRLLSFSSHVVNRIKDEVEPFLHLKLELELQEVVVEEEEVEMELQAYIHLLV